MKDNLIDTLRSYDCQEIIKNTVLCLDEDCEELVDSEEDRDYLRKKLTKALDFLDLLEQRVKEEEEEYS